MKKILLLIMCLCLATAQVAQSKAEKNVKSTPVKTEANQATPAENAAPVTLPDKVVPIPTNEPPIPDQPTPENPVKMQLIVGDPEDSEMGLVGKDFRKFVEEASKGTIQITMSFGGGLGEDEGFQFHKVQSGSLRMAIGGIANLVPMVKNLGILTLPYLFANQEEVERGITGKPAEILNSYALQANLRILGWTCCGFRFISNSKRPITKMEDMRGLRFRVPYSFAMMRTYKAFGGLPSILSWGMTKSALEHDLVDGQCYDYIGFQSMNFAQAGQKYITEVHYQYNLQPMVISEEFFQKLPADLQKILIDAGQHAQAFSFQYQKEETQKAKDALIKEGVQITTLDDETPWIDRAKTMVWSAVAAGMGGKKAINTYLEACGLPLWD